MSLGELQQFTMLAAARLKSEAYGAAIRDELRDVAGKNVTVPTVYVTLVRLEEQGLVNSRETPGKGERGGRARRVFRVTAAGWRALDQAHVAMSRMRRGVARS